MNQLFKLKIDKKRVTLFSLLILSLQGNIRKSGKSGKSARFTLTEGA